MAEEIIITGQPQWIRVVVVGGNAQYWCSQGDNDTQQYEAAATRQVICIEVLF
jgi:hypothetical protein